jgi:hypothetical protein
LARGIGVVGIVLIGFVGPVFGATTQCSDRADGDVTIQEAVTRIRKKPRIELIRVRTKNTVTTDDRFVTTVMRGKKMVLEIEIAVAADGSTTTTRRLGVGFKGIQELVVHDDGATRTLSADGHPVSLAALQATPPSLEFEDGTPVPDLRVKGSVRRLLRKVQKRAAFSCPGGFGSPIRALSQAECDTCFAECFGASYACEVLEIAACAVSSGISCGAQAVISFFNQSYTCGGRLVDCTNACKAPGAECCRFHCGGTCCGQDASSDTWLCAGATPTFAGKCCPRGQECGPNCCDGAPGTAVCANPATGRCCDQGETACNNTCCDVGTECTNLAKSVCCAPNAGCGSYCCRPGERCASPSDEDPDLIVCVACPADKPGPLCGDTCCGAGEVCGFDNECCAPQDLCGGTCCAGAQCLNGDTCCKAGLPCGSECCTAFGSTCCNGQCCLGDCITGLCCPAERSCGPNCCAPGNACANVGTGQCVACPAGQSACGPVPGGGGPTCCPDGQDCCLEGCCAPGLECCTPPNQPPGCYASFLCVQ